MSGPSFIIDADDLDTYLGVPNSNPPGVKNPLASEAVVNVGEGGLSLSVVDPANVGMVGECFLSADAFEAYDAAQGWEMGMNLNRFREILGLADELAHCSLNEEKHKLTVEADHRSVTMALIDPEAIRDSPELPDVELPNTFSVEASVLSDALEVTDLVGDTVYIEVDADAQEVQFRAAGDTDDADLTLDAADCIHAECNETTESIFNHDYLSMLFNPIPDAAEVTLSVGDEFPLRATWTALDGDMTVTQMCAPRIQST
jgi:proliferating cell nuclear antigen